LTEARRGAIVTGAGTGIGRAVALALQADGYSRRLPRLGPNADGRPDMDEVQAREGIDREAAYRLSIVDPTAEPSR
jgi:NAD(P)-dependent dehydrogenase (short-subunit alcohol dehydrogenase family)